VQKGVSRRLGSALASSPSSTRPWVKAMRSWARQINSTQQALLAKSPKGRLRNPVSLAQRMRSSMRAWPRWRASR
jgi:hypothetical protein